MSDELPGGDGSSAPLSEPTHPPAWWGYIDDKLPIPAEASEPSVVRPDPANRAASPVMATATERRRSPAFMWVNMVLFAFVLIIGIVGVVTRGRNAAVVGLAAAAVLVLTTVTWALIHRTRH